MTYAQILKVLQRQREVSVADESVGLAQQARKFLNGNLEHPDIGRTFLYRKSNQWHLCKTDKEITKHWQKLLAEDEDIRSRWRHP